MNKRFIHSWINSLLSTAASLCAEASRFNQHFSLSLKLEWRVILCFMCQQISISFERHYEFPMTFRVSLKAFESRTFRSFSIIQWIVWVRSGMRNLGYWFYGFDFRSIKTFSPLVLSLIARQLSCVVRHLTYIFIALVEYHSSRNIVVVVGRGRSSKINEMKTFPLLVCMKNIHFYYDPT